MNLKESIQKAKEQGNYETLSILLEMELIDREENAPTPEHEQKIEYTAEDVQTIANYFKGGVEQWKTLTYTNTGKKPII